MSDELPKTNHPAEKQPLDQIEMLSQPLLTEDGAINPACLNELEAAIKAIPPLHERLANDPEWSLPWWTSAQEVLRGFCGHAVAAWEGVSVPPQFDLVVGFVREGLRRAMKDYAGVWMANLSLCGVHRILWELLHDLDAFQQWNEKLSTDALLHNTCVHIRDGRRHDLAFDIRFFKQHGASPTHGGMD